MKNEPRSQPRLRLYSRRYCHLCDDMLGQLETLRAELPFDVEVIDVDGDPDLVERYDVLVPMLVTATGEELCHYHLDAEKVREHLGRFG